MDEVAALSQSTDVGRGLSEIHESNVVPLQTTFTVAELDLMEERLFRQNARALEKFEGGALNSNSRSYVWIYWNN